MKLPDQAYMDLKQASVYSTLSVPTLRNHIASGNLPSFKVGGKRIIRISEFDQWIEHHRVKHKADINGVVDDIVTMFKG
jgi:excisionase family DNA binding protein